MKYIYFHSLIDLDDSSDLYLEQNEIIAKKLGFVIGGKINYQQSLEAIYQMSQGYDYIVLGFPDSPFYCYQENKRLKNSIEESRSEYGFGDDHPKGILFEFLFRKCLPAMETFRQQSKIPINRDVFFTLMEKDMNRFELENLYSKKSLRTLRLDFRANNPEKKQLNQDIFLLLANKGGYKKYNEDFFYNDLAECLLEHRASLINLPCYAEIEITSSCQQSCVFCPRTPLSQEKIMDDFMSLDLFEQIVEKLHHWNCEIKIALTGMGEPLLHPEIFEMLNKMNEKKIEHYVETSLSNIDRNISDKIINSGDFTHWIFALESINPQLYHSLRSKELNQVLVELEYILTRKPKNSWLQVVKMKENYDNISEIYRYFRKYTSNIIIQKYNHYRNSLPEKRLNPIEPFEKIDCWHLKRDLSIDVQGLIRNCKQDLKMAHPIAKVMEVDLSKLMEIRRERLKQSVKNWDFCQGCDEYYTYNF